MNVLKILAVALSKKVQFHKTSCAGQSVFALPVKQLSKQLPDKVIPIDWGHHYNYDLQVCYSISSSPTIPTMAAPSVTLSAPYTIFPLSQPLIHQTRNNPTGEGHVRPCYTSSVEIPSTKKRKRVSSEIAVAVDGEGINIYDVSLGLPLGALAGRQADRALTGL